MKTLFYILFVTAAMFRPLDASCGDEPMYQGKPLSVWVGNLGKVGDMEVQHQAQEAIREVGTNAVPYLLDELRTLGESWQNDVPGFYENPALAKRLDCLVRAFVALGPRLRPVIPALTSHIDDNGLATSIIAPTLIKLDPNVAATVLTEALTNRSYYVRTAAATHLYSVGTNGARAVPVLIAYLEDVSSDTNGSSNLRMFSAIALGGIGEPAKEAVPVLTQALQNDKSEDVRSGAAKALRHFESSADQVVPALTRAMREDQTWWIRFEAARSLGSLGTNAVTSLSDLYETSTNDVNGQVRAMADAVIEKLIENPTP